MSEFIDYGNSDFGSVKNSKFVDKSVARLHFYRDKSVIGLHFYQRRSKKNRLFPLKRNVECHPETLGDALQLFDGRVSPSAADAVQILFAPANAPGQFRFTHVFSHMTLFKSILVLFFIIVIVVIVIKYILTKLSLRT